MRAYKILFISLLAAISYSCHEGTEIALLPIPVKCEIGNGFYTIDSAAIANSQFEINLDTTLKKLGNEGYMLTINSKGISLKAQTEIGVFYGKATLNQLLNKTGVPYVEIIDYPRFKHRGIMLDVSRHFFTKDEIKQLLDVMSQYKLNVFHWHLTDDGGWRFEVDGYPELTTKGAFRTHKTWKEWWQNGGKFANEGYGGYYTKEDIREVVAYAAKRHITIIPEVEFPGHSRAVFAAYPELCCAGKAYESNTFCVGNPETYKFMESVLKSTMELFPSEIIHIGGDETNTRPWNTCQKCQSLMKKEGMSDVHQLHKFIVGRAEQIIIAGGRRMIGWDEISSDRLDKSSIIMSWQGEEAGLVAAEKGYDVVLTPSQYLYLDYFQSAPEKGPQAHDGYNTLEIVYNYNPLKTSTSSHILGIQGNLWSEWVSDMDHLEYMLFPRGLAVAEMGWSRQEDRKWSTFRDRAAIYIDRLHSAGINSYRLTSDLEYTMEVDTLKKEISVALKCERNGVEIRYTTDDSKPNSKSALYNAPIKVSDSLNLKAASFCDGVQQGDLLSQPFYYHKAIGKGRDEILTNGYIGTKTYLDGSWQSFKGKKEFVVDLGSVEQIKKVSTRFMHLRAGARRHLPMYVEIQLSQDGINFTSAQVFDIENYGDDRILAYKEYQLGGNYNARYIKVIVDSNNRWSAIDEIIVL